MTQPVCPDCEKKDREIEHLAGSVRNRINDCHTQSIRVIALSQALQEIYKLAKENMWYPCSFENHEAIDREQEKWHGEDVSK